MPRVGGDISILSKGNPDWSMVFINKRPVQSKSVYKVCEPLNPLSNLPFFLSYVRCCNFRLCAST